MKYLVQHTTTYTYSETVPLCHNQAHLTPRDHSWQRCLEHDLRVAPEPALLEEWSDYFGNRVHFFSLELPHQRLIVHSRSLVEVEEPAYPPAAATPGWEEARRAVQDPQQSDARIASQFAFDSPYIHRLETALSYARPSFPPGRPLLEAALDLTARIASDFRYDPVATCVNTPTEEVLAKRRGVCQDFAHLQITCLRSLGLAARYVSGYLLTDPPPGQPKLIGADASHAWLSVFCPSFGWLDLDPTNNQLAKARHVTLAWGRDYGDVCPVKGVLIGGGHHTLSVAVDVTPA